MPEKPTFLTTEEGAKIVQVASTWDKTPYVSGKAQKGIGADCSWSTWAIYKEAGFQYSYASSSSIKASSHFKMVPNPQEGDVACWAGQHVAIYAGDNMIWTAHNTKGPGYSKMSLPVWIKSAGGKQPVWLRYCK